MEGEGGIFFHLHFFLSVLEKKIVLFSLIQVIFFSQKKTDPQ